MTISWLITAEHASNRVPERWQSLFAGHELVLDTHRAWDPGSLELARTLAGALDAPCLEGRVTRLLIDLNRSARHPRRYSEFTRSLAPELRAELEQRYWTPHWDGYRQLLDTLPGRIVHLACHSFTPVLDGKVRRTDIGLLYDPARPLEAGFCRALGRELRRRLPELRVHMNQPYRGISDGMGQHHRRYFPDRRLISFELEINQRLLDRLPALGQAVLEGLRATERSVE